MSVLEFLRRCRAVRTPLWTILLAAWLGCPTVLALEGSEAGPATMRAIVHAEYGGPEVLRLEQVEKPVVEAGQVLVKVLAASVNPLDWHYLRGTPYIVRLMDAAPFRPGVPRLGVDLAGVVEAVGSGVTRFKPGDEVFGYRYGAYAEYVRTAEKTLVLKPANTSFEEAAAVPIAAVSALQALRDTGELKPGQKVLINGASGGVGTYAVQIAKALGAEVTGVCSTRNIELVRSLGADHVIDYTQQDFTLGNERYDLIIDMVANHPLSALSRVMTPEGILVGVGSKEMGQWLGPVVSVLEPLVYSLFTSQQFKGFLATLNRDDLEVLAGLMQSGKMKSMIDRRYSLAETAEAIRHVEEGRTRGKVVIFMDHADPTSAPVSPAAEPASHVLGDTLKIVGFMLLVIGVPVVLALQLNRQYQRDYPGGKPYRWGYWFAIQSFVAGTGIGLMLDSGVYAAIVCIALYTVLSWFFAQRRRWAWIALTLLSFNPLFWVINFFYLRGRGAGS